MSYRLHPTKNKKLKPGDLRYYQIECGHGEDRVTVVKQFATDAAAQVYDNELKRAYRPEISTIIAPSFEQIVPDFLEWRGTEYQPGSKDTWIQSWNNLEPHFGKLKPNYLTQQLVDQYKSHRLTQKAGVRNNLVCKRTVQKEIHALSALISYAVERKLCEPLPFKIKTFPKNQTASKKKIIPSPKQVEEMLSYTRSDMRPLYQMIYYTGMRSAEIRSIKVKNVDLARNLMLVTGKGNKQRFIPIIPQLKPVVEQLIKDRKPNDYLLISSLTGKAYKPNIGRIDVSAKKAGINVHMSAHMLRHCFGTHCIYWGLDTRTVQMLLGHASITTTQIYTELAAVFLTQELNRFGKLPIEPEQIK
jgi:integrase/recombinase XerC